MSIKLTINPTNPPTGALIAAELINSQNKTKIEVAWHPNWKDSGNIKLTDKDENLLATTNNEVYRYIARTYDVNLYGGTNARERTEVDHWLCFAIGPLGMSSLKENSLIYLNHVLLTNTWLVAKKLTIADVSVFSELLDKNFLNNYEKQYPNVTRWYKQILSLPIVVEVLAVIKRSKVSSVSNDIQEGDAKKSIGSRKQEGKFIDLPGAEMGKVVVRFPPEASGYLHIGHAKAALLNQYYAENFQGQLIMRFDDTNPAKENVEFEKAILHDLELLQIKPDKFTHTSDYFDLMLEYCTKLITEGKAFVDDTPANVMKIQRDQKEMSANRENSVEANLKLWNEMQKGTSKGQECCVRAKIDYESVNGCLRDPTIYRCKPEPHPRTGTKYKVYPTYDFACPIVDAIENVTHTLRTTEYHDRDAQFYWIIDALKLRRPYIWAYSRLNMTNTVLSKRKLTWFVEEGLVDGWDDPRFPTVRGILRRGMTVEGLKQFIIAQGSSRSVVFMEWDKIWSFNKKVIDPLAHRYTALEHGKTVSVHVVDALEEWITVQNHPKDPSKGTKKVYVSPKILIEKDDADALIEGKDTTFINWGNLTILTIKRDNGVVTNVEARLNLQNKNYKNTLKITWLAASHDADTVSGEHHLVPCYCVYFDHIINKPIVGKDEDFKEFVGQNTRKEVQMLGEPELKRVVKGEIIQLQRKGFFRCDVPYASVSPFSCREQPIILFHIPDGHTGTPSTTVSTTVTASTKCTQAKSKKNEEQTPEMINKEIITQEDKIHHMKAEKASKSVVDNEVKILLSLKAEYKLKTGVEWKPLLTVNDVKVENKDLQAKIDKISNEIQKQGDRVRELKNSKSDKVIVDQEVKILLALKSDYKAITGCDWKAPKPSTNNTTESLVKSKDTECINTVLKQIQEQGDKVRQLKSSKADKSTIDQEIKLLLKLKGDYKNLTGEDWKLPKPNANSNTSLLGEDKNIDSVNTILKEIQEQGDKVRQLKSSKANKNTIDQEVKLLLKLKSDYKALTGEDWKLPKPKGSNTPSLPVENRDTESVNTILKQIQEQGDKVRQLKSSKADKSTIEQEVKVLLKLKSDYKTKTGEDWKPPAAQASQNKKQQQGTVLMKKESDKEVPKSTVCKDVDINKTGTRLGLEVKKNENFFEWYSQIITKSGMIEYYDVSGCYILRPWSFGIWKVIKDYIDKEITKLGVQECYFPIFVTKNVLEKEKTHIADFAPEVAWVTKCGESDLAEPIAIRPTSETVMYPAYAKWLRSDTELPLRLNQWNNVVRWEFKDPKPFLRTREFLWQEGHTAFATKAEADEEVLIILDIYAKVYEDLLAVPVIKGRKTEKEKFAGGDYTTTVEAFISTSGRAIQGATSHHLGQNFSKMFNIQVEGAGEGDEKTFVYQNSWGLTTRTIGVMIMVHGDDKGLVLPPNVASIQAVLVPCGITASTSTKQRELLLSECVKLMSELTKDSTLRVKADYRNNRTPGWKFNHWELKGVPIRIELGPKDLEKNQVTFVRRDTFERVVADRAVVLASLLKLLKEIQSSMLARASNNLKNHIKQVENWNDFYTELNKKNLLLSPFCGEITCEDNIKTDSAREDAGEELGALSMGAKSLCIPFDQPHLTTAIENLKCIHPNCQNKPKFYTLFGRSY